MDEAQKPNWLIDIQDDVMTLEQYDGVWVLAEDYRALQLRIAALEHRLAIARRAMLDVSNGLQSLAAAARIDGETIPHLAVLAASLALRDAHKASEDAEAVRAALREMQAIGEEMDEEDSDG